MAYTKTAAVTTPGAEAPATIAFAFSKDELFDNVSMQSNYMTKTMTDTKGGAISEEYALSGDDKGAFETILGVVMSEVFEIFQKQTQGIENSYSITGKTVVAPAVADTVTVKINDHAAYNSNSLDLVDLSLRDCILDGCLQGWFSLRAHSDLTNFAAAKYSKQIENLKKRLFGLKIRRAFVSTLNG